MCIYSIRKLIPSMELDFRTITKSRIGVNMLNIIDGCLFLALKKFIRLEYPCMNSFPRFSIPEGSSPTVASWWWVPGMDHGYPKCDQYPVNLPEGCGFLRGTIICACTHTHPTYPHGSAYPCHSLALQVDTFTYSLPRYHFYFVTSCKACLWCFWMLDFRYSVPS